VENEERMAAIAASKAEIALCNVRENWVIRLWWKVSSVMIELIKWSVHQSSLHADETGNTDVRLA